VFPGSVKRRFSVPAFDPIVVARSQRQGWPQAIAESDAQRPGRGRARRQHDRGRRASAQPRVGPHFVIVLLPSGQNDASLPHRGEQRLVQALIAQLAVEAFNESVLLRLAGRDVVPADTAVLGPGQHRAAGQLCAIVADHACRVAAPGGDGVQVAHDALAG
jgi:hypothetical protein